MDKNNAEEAWESGNMAEEGQRDRMYTGVVDFVTV